MRSSAQTMNSAASSGSNAPDAAACRSNRMCGHTSHGAHQSAATAVTMPTKQCQPREAAHVPRLEDQLEDQLLNRLQVHGTK